MGAISIPEDAAKTGPRSGIRRKLYSALFFLILWTVSLTVLLVGLPFIALQTIRSLRSKPPI